MKIERYRRRRRTVLNWDFAMPLIAGVSVIVWGLAVYGAFSLLIDLGVIR